MGTNNLYVIFDYSEIDKINFDEVKEESIDTLRRSIDGTKTFVKWEGEIPNCINNLTTISQVYNYEQITSIMETDEWIGKYKTVGI